MYICMYMYVQLRLRSHIYSCNDIVECCTRQLITPQPQILPLLILPISLLPPLPSLLNFWRWLSLPLQVLMCAWTEEEGECTYWTFCFSAQTKPWKLKFAVWTKSRMVSNCTYQWGSFGAYIHVHTCTLILFMCFGLLHKAHCRHVAKHGEARTMNKHLHVCL